ncbi:hypothetical protein IAU60_002881 [Kwoniella sp. DSM 27419]
MLRLSHVNRILLISCVVVAPCLAIKEHYLSNELEQVAPARHAPHERAMRARIVQLEQERKELLKEGENLDQKIIDLKRRMATA